MRKTFSETFNEVLNAPEKEDKVMVLQNNNTAALRQLLAAALDSHVVFDVGEIPSYRENNETDGYSANSLHVEYRRLYIFMNTYNKVSPERKRALLVQILESIDRSDAIVLIDVIKKDLSKYGIDKDLVNAAFQGLIKE